MSSAAQKIIQAAAGNAGAEPGPNVEDVFSTYLYEGNGSTQSIQNGIALGSGDPVISLQGYTFTSIGSTINSSYPLSNINDGVAETSNAQNLTYVADGNFDVYVDLQTPQTVTAYLIAPQGGGGQVYNTPLNFKVHGSSDGSNWTEIEYFQSISTGSSNWTAGTYREFSFTNTTAYRYWRFDHIGDGSNGSGVAISELQFKVDGGDAEVKGGLVWLKNRDAAVNHQLHDTERGVGVGLNSNNTNAEYTDANSLTAFNSNGFTVGPNNYNSHNQSGVDFASWTFAKQEKFFDVVTWTGTGSDQTISHNLGSVPGCIIIKDTSTTNNWIVWHNSIHSTVSESDVLVLNTTTANTAFGATYIETISSSSFVIKNGYSATNTSGRTYVAYLFAHNDDDGGFGEDADQDIIKCGSYTGTGSAGNFIDLGFEPQWVLVKNSSATGGWFLGDNMRGVATGGVDAYLYANTSDAEATTNWISFNSTGFTIDATGTQTNGNGNNHIYIAIRRGPMKTPESGTEVFDVQAYAGFGTANTPVALATSSPVLAPDAIFITSRGQYNKNVLFDRLRNNNSTTAQGGNGLATYSTATETALPSDATGSLQFNQRMYGYEGQQSYWAYNGRTYVNYIFKRAPGFFDVVAYEGNSSNQNVNHNLGSVPELMIMKKRSNTGPWAVYHSGTDSTAPEDYVTFLNTTGARGDQNHWSDTAPTSTQFTLGPKFDVNQSGEDYIAYLFATVPGVSKVGSYTGNGTSQTIDCGFSAGARFVLIKRTDSTGDWHFYDSERGIVASFDPRLELNTTVVEEPYADDIDPVSSGFSVTSSASVNTNNAEYIFLAIA